MLSPPKVSSPSTQLARRFHGAGVSPSITSAKTAGCVVATVGHARAAGSCSEPAELGLRHEDVNLSCNRSEPRRIRRRPESPRIHQMRYCEFWLTHDKQSGRI